MKPGEHKLREFAADRRPRLLLFAKLGIPSKPETPPETVTLINTPALRLILKDNGL